ncbi:hypothetical protein CERZMDRAFT_99755 [Cercospora zeae-maydis SCOH1-5]|uniref:Uncharacterized protein n=1 Tax=Cercospora zeae-maydis SCOH1-5 TaxID=717836 RepID=A0A6A6F9H7_9PEZI|nr:hypothetical protein CERZMDRAFT_99755 [Cercospora zeae-maydis SCOH1-5]
MAAILDRNDPASPSAYDASQTALLLLDFQPFIIDQVVERGSLAREATVPKTDKGAFRLQQSVASLGHDQEYCKKCSRVAPKFNELDHTT